MKNGMKMECSIEDGTQYGRWNAVWSIGLKQVFGECSNIQIQLRIFEYSFQSKYTSLCIKSF